MKTFLFLLALIFLSANAHATRHDNPNKMTDTIDFSEKSDPSNSTSLEYFNISVTQDNKLNYHDYDYDPNEFIKILTQAKNEFPALSLHEVDQLFTLARDENNYILLSVFKSLAKNYLAGNLDDSIISLQAKIMTKKRQEQ